LLITKLPITNYDDVLKNVKEIKPCAKVFDLLSKKGFFCALKISQADNRALAILKQEALALGAELCVCESISRFKMGLSDAILFITLRGLERLAAKLFIQPYGLKEMAAEFEAVLKNICKSQRTLRYKDKEINLNKPVVMGIINMDPNSFSGDGLTNADQAVKQACQFEKEGAKIIDLGAESSRPGVKLIDAKTEIARLIPALKKIRKATNLPISIDTYKYETAKAAFEHGADIINDIFALRVGRQKLARLIADQKLGVILMHSKGKPQNMQKDPHYKNCTVEVYQYLKQAKEYALSFGILPEFISVDPGIGFAKTVEHNLEILKNAEIFRQLGILTVGASRKNFVRKSAGADELYYVAANVLAARNGADIVRVHDVKKTVRAMRLI
jgi:dihydropteroate synthase